MKRTLIEVIPRAIYRCRDTGLEASVWGAHPGPSYDRIISGWTWRVTSVGGSVTYGLCRLPAKTVEEANAVAKDISDRRGHRVIYGVSP